MLDEGVRLLACRRARAAGVRDADLSKGLAGSDFDFGVHSALFLFSLLPAARYIFALSSNIFSAF